ncbi:MAG: glutamate--tRNA ligase [Gemmatimonadota bacterium]
MSGARGRRYRPSTCSQSDKTISDQTSVPRVRFAPSPTGFLHVGGARTALFNYLFARSTGGAFLLRIEDTDRERSSQAMTEQIQSSMAWLGLEVDETPVHQADGLERHREAADALLSAGLAYRCYLAQEEIAERRAAAKADGRVFRYRSLRGDTTGSSDDSEAADRGGAGRPFALLFRVPDGATEWDDAVHGQTRFANDNLDDFIILRSDGTPVYQLAVVSDDIDMGITHVIRGDDHLSNTPRQVMIYRALGAEPPVFAHVPMILGPDGKRLSKRHGATSVEAYRDEQGILPAAMVNFLALLGWSPGDDREIMDLSELVEAFSLDRILKKSSVFDPRKLEWLNGQHLSRMDAAVIVSQIQSDLIELAPAAADDAERLHQVIDLVKTRARTLADVVRQAVPYFSGDFTYDEAAVRKYWKDPIAAAIRLAALAGIVAETEPFDPDTLERELRALADTLEISAAKLIHPLRVALVGAAVSPGIFEVLELMGGERSLHRIERARDYLARIPAEG